MTGVDPVYEAGLAVHPELALLDWPEQRIRAACAMRVRAMLARGGTYPTVQAAARLRDPRPLTGSELAALDRLARSQGDRTIARDLAGRSWPILAAPQVVRARQRDLGKRLARIEQQLADRLYQAAQTVMREALQRAGVKARVRAKKRAKQAQLDLEEVGMTEAVLAAISVNADELLDRAFSSYQTDAQRWMAEAARKRRKAIAQSWDLDEEELEDENDDSRNVGAAALLTGLLLGAARQALGITSPAREPVVSIPFSMIRTAMRVKDGATVLPSVKGGFETQPPRVSPVERLMAQAAERATPLPDPAAIARGEEIPVNLEGVVPTLVANYEWVHGYFGEPNKPFEPHVILDGQTYTDETRGEVLAKDPGEFPEGRFEWSVDDHDSCTCYEVVTWEPAGAGE